MKTATLWLLAAGTILVTVSAPSAAQERRDIPEFRTYGDLAIESDREDIRRLIEQYKSAWGRQDVEKLSQLHSSDVEWINAYARILRGVPELAEFLELRLFPAFDPEVSVREAENMKMISLRYLGDNAAVVHLYTDGDRGVSRNTNEAQRRTHLHLVLEKQNDAWLVAHTAIMDAR